MKTEKKDRKSILTSIREEVMKSPKSMYELSKILGSNWDTIRKNVALLEELGILKLQGSKIVLIQPSFRSSKKDTIAGIPISTEMKKKVYAIANLFYNEWNNNNSRYIPNTVFQKAVVKLSDKFPSLNIPRGWYLFGKVVLVKLSEEIIKENKTEYNLRKEINNYNNVFNEVKETAKNFSGMKTVDIINEQYEDHNANSYKTKRKIDELIISSDLESNKMELSKTIYELVLYFQLRKDNELSTDIFGFIKDGVLIILDILNDKIEVPKEYKKILLLDLINVLWNLNAIYNLYITREGDFGYDNGVIDLFFEDKIHFFKQQFLDHFGCFGERG